MWRWSRISGKKKMEAKIEKMRQMFTKDLEELKNRQTEMNNTLEEIHGRITEAEEWINDLEDWMVEITARKQNIEKKMKRNEDSLWGLCNNIKCTNIHILGVPEEEEREKTWVSTHRYYIICSTIFWVQKWILHGLCLH